MKCYHVLIFLCFFTTRITGQYSRHIVQFTDKNNTPFLINAPAAYLSQKAIDRRIRQKIAVDSTDLPLNTAYVDSLRSVPNVFVLNQSKWLNQVLIQTTDSLAMTRIRLFPFVKNATAIAARTNPGETVIQEKFREPITLIPEQARLSQSQKEAQAMDSIAYGNTYAQINIHEGQFLHNKGYTGEGIVIAVLDAGFFGYKTNPALDSVRLQNRILGEYDFVNNESSVNEDHSHGLQCLSIIAMNRPGIMVGSAPQASFYLFRTEDAASEYPVEEQNWVVAAEKADSAGVDMISSSLGYADYKNPDFNLEYAERNGNTSISTTGADMAAKKGIIVMNSAGNSGNLITDYKYVTCPADGDSVVAVGAVDANGNIASFSSWGPNSAGKIKPDIVSVGQGTIFASNTGSPAAGNGTSYSNPNVAGLIACLWQAFPDFINMEIIRAVQKSSHKYLSPDERFGYGIPNFRKAFDILTTERTLRNAAVILQNDWIKVFPVPFNSQVNVLFKGTINGPGIVQLIDVAGRIIETKQISIATGQFMVVTFATAGRLQRGVYFIRYLDDTKRRTIKMVKN